ncbi:MAG: hypothetical protein RJA69_1011 [Pseudomonadota bacterium]|jgi:hypothetical protein
MTAFVNVDFPRQHPGVERAKQVIERFERATATFDGARGVATLLLAALVAALLVVANEVIETWSDGHLLAAWIALWLVGFAALALLAQPMRALTVRGPLAWRHWRVARREAAQDARLWGVAQHDSRVMADILCAMGRAE